MPAKAGIQSPWLLPLDSRFRGNDARSQGLAVYITKWTSSMLRQRVPTSLLSTAISYAPPPPAPPATRASPSAPR